MANTTSGFLKIASVCGVAGTIILLLSDLFLIATGRMFEWTLGLWLAFLLIIPAVLGFTYHLVAKGSRLAYVGGASAFFGLMAGASMQVLFRVHAVLLEQGADAAVTQLRGTMKLVATTQMIGLTWPLGLILLAIANLMVDRGRWLISVLFAIGAVAFPIGRIAGSNAGVIISGLVFVPAFYLVARLLSAEESSLA
jgi:hypothetical protein